MKLSWPATILLALVVGIVAAAVGRGQPADSGAPTPPDTGSTADPVRHERAEPAASATPAAGTGGSPYVVTLTFDDGPHPTYTPQVLKVLREHDVKAVFCVVGERVRQHPELVRRIVADGHQLCNHTQTHDSRLGERSAARIEREISQAARAIEAAAPDAEVRYFRQPVVHVTDDVARVARDHGYTPLNWTIDPRDWNRPGTEAVVARVFDELAPGAIVLLHDGGGNREQTVAALDTILDTLDSASYQVALPEPS